jgi:hypothetical protein
MKKFYRTFLLLATSCAAFNPANGQSLCFDPASDNRYETAHQCLDMAAVDFDEDGITDILASNNGDPTSFSKGNGDGTFQPFQSLQYGGGEHILLRDTDLDGDLDILRYYDGNLVISLNNGDGTISLPAYLGVDVTDQIYSQFGAGDVTGDGRIDAVANDMANDILHVFVGDNAGGLLESFSLNTLNEPGNVTVGDVDGDGLDDIICSYASLDQITLFLANGGQSFDTMNINATTTINGGYAEINIVDIDGDTDNDILVGGAGGLRILKNNGSEVFTPAADVFMGTYCFEMTTGDWDGDGDTDVAWANGYNGGVTINLNNGDGTFPAIGNSLYSSNGQALNIEQGDFDADGIIDLVVGNGFDNNFAFLKGDGEGKFGSKTLMAGYLAKGLAVADFDNDGDLDVVATNTFPDPAIALSRNNGDGSFADTEFIANVSESEECVAGDFNEDGDMDLAIHTTNGYAIRLGNGNGTFANAVLFDTNNPGAGGERAIVSGDFNNDGNLDLAGSRPGSDAVSVILGNGNGTFDAPEIMTDSGYPRTLLAAEFDGDNFDDLIVCSNTTDEVWIYFSNGNGTFATPFILSATGNPEGLTACDADEDGNLDLIVGSPNANKLYTFLGNNNGTFDAPLITDIPTSSNSSRLDHADINNDGHQDILSALFQIDAVGVFFGNGDGTFQSAITYGVDKGPNRIIAADFNGDGAMDYSTLNSGVFNVSVVLNNSAFITASGELAFCDGDSVQLFASEGYSYLWSNGEETQSISAGEQGEYYCAITNQSGDCTLITPIVEVEVFTGQDVTLSLDSTLVCIENGDFFMSGGFPFGGQYTGSGIVANNFDPAAAGEGVYTITYTYEDAASCTNASATDIITVDLCSVIEEQDSHFKVYPTLVNNQINIQSNSYFEYRILDMNGSLVKYGRSSGLNEIIDVSNLANGCYCLNLVTKYMTETLRIEIVR